MLSVSLVIKKDKYNLITPYYTYVFKKNTSLEDIINVINEISSIELYTSKDSSRYMYSNFVKDSVMPSSIQKTINISLNDKNNMNVNESSSITYKDVEYKNYLKSIISIIEFNKGSDVKIICKDISINILALLNHW